MFSIVFPEPSSQHYWDIHYLYVLRIFQYLKCSVSFQAGLDVTSTSFKCCIDGKWFLFDFSDSATSLDNPLPTFKFHCSQETDGIFCFPPVSFYDWDQYYQLEKEIQYNPLSSFWVSSRQRPYGGAVERRVRVQNILRRIADDHERLCQNNGWVVNDADKHKVFTDIIEQEEYWKEINNINIAVFVPGHHNNMIDRGHLQYLAFGCLTVSPDLPECLPFGRKLIGYDNFPKLMPQKTDAHYLKCKDDYSNLISIIMWNGIHSFVHPFSQISENAKTLFKETCTPEAIGRWIGSKL